MPPRCSPLLLQDQAWLGQLDVPLLSTGAPRQAYQGLPRRACQPRSVRAMRPRPILAMAIVAALGFAAPVKAAEPTAEGLWEQSDGKGHVGGWFFIFKRGGVYDGALVKMFVKPGEDPNPICTACSGDQKDQPTLGLVMIKNMERDGRTYRGGTILDPRDGKVYDAMMEVSGDGRKLKLRGYLA